MERTREMHIAERERRLAILNRLMEENDLAVMVCHGNGAMAYQADVKYMTDLATPCGHMFSMMVRGEQPIALLGRADAGFHARLKTFLDADHVVITRGTSPGGCSITGGVSQVLYGRALRNRGGDCGHYRGFCSG